MAVKRCLPRLPLQRSTTHYSCTPHPFGAAGAPTSCTILRQPACEFAHIRLGCGRPAHADLYPPRHAYCHVPSKHTHRSCPRRACSSRCLTHTPLICYCDPATTFVQTPLGQYACIRTHSTGPVHTGMLSFPVHPSTPFCMFNLACALGSNKSTPLSAQHAVRHRSRTRACTSTRYFARHVAPRDSGTVSVHACPCSFFAKGMWRRRRTPPRTS